MVKEDFIKFGDGYTIILTIPPLVENKDGHGLECNSDCPMCFEDEYGEDCYLAKMNITTGLKGRDRRLTPRGPTCPRYVDLISKETL